MALDIKQYFFDSIDPTGTDPGDERIYPADEFVQGAIASLVTNGIYNAGDNCKIVPTEYEYTVAMLPGRAYIDGYSMNAVAAYADEDVRQLLAIAPPTGAVRCDRVVIRLNRDMTLEGRYIKPMVIAGTEGMTEPPELVRTAELYDLSLATVTVRQGTAIIPAEDIADTRFDPELCGTAGFKPQPDLSDLVGQFYTKWSTEYAEALEEALAGFASYEDIPGLSDALDGKANAPVVAENVQIPSSAWTQTDTYEDYPFSATATVAGVTADMIPEVVFALTDATSGMFAPVADPTVDGVTIYAAEQPEGTLTVPTIIGWPKNTQ